MADVPDTWGEEHARFVREQWGGCGALSPDGKNLCAKKADHPGLHGWDDADTLAKVAYNAYGDARGWRVFNGGPMPIWEDQEADLQAAWRAAAQGVASFLLTEK